ncbi:MAG: hypothetical protein ACKODT_07300 [Fluviibacter sp.]
MTEYRAGHVKHNPDLDEVAIRTIFPLDQGANLASMAWLIATKATGAKTVRMEDIDGVDGWLDVYEPPLPPPITPADLPEPPPPADPGGE